MADSAQTLLDPAGVIDALGGPAVVAKHFSIPYSTVASWKDRSRIPDDHRPEFVRWAAERGIEGITAETMMLMHARSAAAAGAGQ
jgi:hypothetical protein